MLRWCAMLCFFSSMIFLRYVVKLLYFSGVNICVTTSLCEVSLCFFFCHSVKWDDKRLAWVGQDETRTVCSSNKHGWKRQAQSMYSMYSTHSMEACAWRERQTASWTAKIKITSTRCRLMVTKPTSHEYYEAMELVWHRPPPELSMYR